MSSQKKLRFQINYDFLDHTQDEKLSQAAVQQLLEGEKSLKCDDLELRKEWLSEENCKKVQLTDITVYHSSVCAFALRAQYRVEYTNSKILIKQGQRHYFAKAVFSFQDNEEIIKLIVKRKDSTIKVQPKRKGVKGETMVLNNIEPNQIMWL